jgi:hypothetical protein
MIIKQIPLTLRSPSEIGEIEGYILVALWGAHKWEIVEVGEYDDGSFCGQYRNGEPANPDDWQWWADLRELDQ